MALGNEDWRFHRCTGGGEKRKRLQGRQEPAAPTPVILAQSSRALSSNRGFQAVVRARCQGKSRKYISS